MYMNLKPNQHKRISSNTTTMTSLGFIALTLPPPVKFSSPQIYFFCSGPTLPPPTPPTIILV